jgi:branched-subunit amino acid aminotransferase/4-amino-4-deoxychorismate lyase
MTSSTARCPAAPAGSRPSPTTRRYVPSVRWDKSIRTIARRRALTGLHCDVLLQVLRAQMDAKSKGFTDVLYLDSVHKRHLEEVSSCNVFVVKGGVVATPDTRGTILPGITRKSVIELARDRGYKVEERLVSIDDLMGADEVFCTGTAVVVAPVSTVTYQGER